VSSDLHSLLFDRELGGVILQTAGLHTFNYFHQYLTTMCVAKYCGASKEAFDSD
jgi:hypothetical protein